MTISSPISLGADSTLLHFLDFNSEIDPSGFTQCGFDANSTKKVLILAHDAWSTIMQSLPKNVSIPMPLGISIYMEKTHTQQEGPAAAVSYRFDRKLASIEQQLTETDYKINIIKYPIPEIRGIILRFTPKMLQSSSDDIYEILIHEMFHVLTHQAFAASHFLAEIFAERMTQCLLPQRDSRELRHLHWSPMAFSSTCGFRIDDFSEVRGNNAFRDLVTIYALNSLMSIPLDNIWRIVSQLLRQAHSSQFCPNSIEALQVIKLVIGGSNMEDILNSVIIKPLKEGKQCFFCPFGKEIFAFCFDVQANKKYLHAPLEESLSWDKYQFLVTEAVTQLTVTVEDRNGKRYIADTILQGEQQFSYKTLLSVFSSTENFLSKHNIKNISCEALGIKAVF